MTTGKDLPPLDEDEPDQPAAPLPGFYCVHCGRTSYSVDDLIEGYCGKCHHFCAEVSGR